MSFTALEASDFVVSADSVTAPAWSGNVPTLTQFFTTTTGISSSYYIDVYNTASGDINAAVQFSIAYGQVSGSGSAPLNVLVPGVSPTRINFGQFRNLIYGDAESSVNFGGTTTSSVDLGALVIDRNRYKESLFPGTFNLRLGNGGNFINLTDNSRDVTTITYLDCGRAFNIISGSNGTIGTNTTVPTGATAAGYTSAGSYGLFLPDIGTIILNPSALNLATGAGGLGINWSTTNTVATNLTNQTLIYDAIVAGASFQLNSDETISSNYVFVRVRNSDYNYTTNPSIITGSGDFIYSNFVNQPQTFITTVGLFNTNNDLLAVAKLSKPLTKDFTKEALIRVKLDW